MAQAHTKATGKPTKRATALRFIKKYAPDRTTGIGKHNSPRSGRKRIEFDAEWLDEYYAHMAPGQIVIVKDLAEAYNSAQHTQIALNTFYNRLDEIVPPGRPVQERRYRQRKPKPHK